MDSTVVQLFQKLSTAVENASKNGLENFPYYAEKIVVEVWLRIWDSLYSPKQIFHNLVLVAVIQTLVVSLQTFSNLTHAVIMRLTDKGRKEHALLNKLASATSYCEWRDIASELDELHGENIWRNIDVSSLYDSKTVAKRISGTIDMLDKGDVFNLMFRLRGGLARDQFGVQHSGLFSRALAGTKHIVERYHEAMASALTFICDTKDAEVPTDAKLAFFNETRHSYGRTALLLSGGGYLGYYHMGVVKALWTQVMLPRVISGSSAGSIMTAIIGTRTDEQLCALVMEKSVPSDMRMDFLNHSMELRHPRAKYLQSLMPDWLKWYSSVVLCMIFDEKLYNLDTPRFISALQQDIGHETFQEAFDRTGRIINITVAPLNNYDPPRLLNYITAPHVCVWSAAAASSAIPGMFDPVALIVKEPDGQFRPENEWTRQGLIGVDAAQAAKMASYSDGSVESDLPMQQLSELFNVNHFIVSQVNPHSAMLTSMALQATMWSNPLYRAIVGYARFLKNQTRDWLKNILNLFIFRSNAPAWSAKRGLIQTLTQEYEGRDCDVTIMPWTGHISPYTAIMSTIKNPTEKEYLDLLSVAEKNTWPHIPRIRAHCLVEKTLDKCVQKLRRCIIEESDDDLVTLAGMSTANHSPIKSRDRTPSFYTSRSIANLSGLSVADPTPIQTGGHSETWDLTPPAETNEKSQLPTRLRKSSLSNVWSLGRSTDEIEEDERLKGRNDEDLDGDEGLVVQGGDTDQFEGDAFWNLSTRIQNAPLTGGLRRSSPLLQSADDLLKKFAYHDTPNNVLSSGSHDDLAHVKPIKRRPSMANFYYKHSCISAANLQDANTFD